VVLLRIGVEEELVTGPPGVEVTVVLVNGGIEVEVMLVKGGMLELVNPPLGLVVSQAVTVTVEMCVIGVSVKEQIL